MANRYNRLLCFFPLPVANDTCFNLPPANLYRGKKEKETRNKEKETRNKEKGTRNKGQESRKKK